MMNDPRSHLLLDEHWGDESAFERPEVRAAAARMMFAAYVLAVAVTVASLALLVVVVPRGLTGGKMLPVVLVLLIACTASLGVAYQAWQLSRLAPRLATGSVDGWLGPLAAHLRWGWVYAAVIFLGAPALLIVLNFL